VAKAYHDMAFWTQLVERGIKLVHTLSSTCVVAHSPSTA